MRFLHYNDSDNLGDNVACPLDYFGNLFPGSEKADIKQAKCGEVAVIGGGGMLFPSSLDLLANLGPSIAWGCGTNVHGTMTRTYPDFLNRWTLVGLRDEGNPYRFVPDASCMSDEFNTISEPTEPTVVYEHMDYPIDVDAPKRNNRGKASDFHDTIDFLKRGKVVVTNSYHGAYWGLLLGREVHLHLPFSSRFFHLPCYYNGMVLTPRDGMLAQCRILNRAFALRVAELIN